MLVTLLLLGLLIGGGSYVGGFDRTTLMRIPGAASWLTVLSDFWSWTGVITVLAVCGVIISLVNRQGRARTWLLVVLTVAAILGPLEQARLHTATSLDKHVGLGAWFAASPRVTPWTGLSPPRPRGGTRLLTIGACVLALAFPISLGASQSRAFATSWACWSTTTRDACWSRIRPSPSTTCPPGANGSGGQAPGTSSCPRGRARGPESACRRRRPGQRGHLRRVHTRGILLAYRRGRRGAATMALAPPDRDRHDG